MKSYTDIEQSKKLAEFLPLESADMHFVNDKHAGCVSYLEITKGSNPWLKGVDISPCWSLAALVGILTENKICHYDNRYYCQYISEGDEFPAYSTSEYNNPIDACYEMIIKLHEQNLL